MANYRWSPKKGESNMDSKKLLSTAILVAAVLLVAVTVLTCFYTVDDKQQAVVTTFGKVTDVTDAGLHFKWPLGIQEVEKVDVNVYQKIELGYATQQNGNYTTKTNESTMITGDYNIVNVDFFVEYKISDPVQYLYSSNKPELILRNLIQSQVRNVVGSTSVDAVLTDGKENVQMQVKELVTGSLLPRMSLRPLRRWKPQNNGQKPWSTMPRLIKMPSCPMQRPRRISSCRMPSI